LQEQGKPDYDLVVMVRAVKVVLALLCIVCVLALCVAPWVDPPETTFRALQIILFLMSSFAVFAALVIGILPSRSQFSLPFEESTFCAFGHPVSQAQSSILRC
jgi:peptidoglycan biosynthesis protein MviN/MurJ (putative lipid II flippase)